MTRAATAYGPFALAVACAVTAFAATAADAAPVPAAPPAHAPPPPLRVACTLPAYYDWCVDLAAGVPVTCVPAVSGGFRAHGFEPTAADLAPLRDADLVVAEGGGHDPWLETARRAAGSQAPVFRPADALPPGPGAGHGFLSLTRAVPQVRALAGALRARVPVLSRTRLGRNRRAKVRAIRGLLRRGRRALAGRRPPVVAAMHGGYGPLLRDLGVPAPLVLEARHGVPLSVGELAAAGDRLARAGAAVLLVEPGVRGGAARVLAARAGARVVAAGHGGARFEAGAWTAGMTRLVETLVRALGGEW